MNDITDKIEKLNKEYLEYKEADMNKEANQIKQRINKLEKELKLEELKNLNALKEENKKLKFFIRNKGMLEEFLKMEETK